jgi:hypothetical protein
VKLRRGFESRPPRQKSILSRPQWVPVEGIQFETRPTHYRSGTGSSPPEIYSLASAVGSRGGDPIRNPSHSLSFGDRLLPARNLFSRVRSGSPWRGSNSKPVPLTIVRGQAPPRQKSILSRPQWVPVEGIQFETRPTHYRSGTGSSPPEIYSFASAVGPPGGDPIRNPSASNHNS